MEPFVAASFTWPSVEVAILKASLSDFFDDSSVAADLKEDVFAFADSDIEVVDDKVDWSSDANFGDTGLGGGAEALDISATSSE